MPRLLPARRLAWSPELPLEELDLAARSLAGPLGGGAGLRAHLARRPPLAWIGSGISRIAAELGARMSHRRLGSAATVFTPLEYCSIPGRPYTPVLVSYGGGNVDILSAARHIAEQRPRRAILLTGFRDTTCEALLTKAGVALDTIVLPEHARERRFVAVLPLIAISGLALRLTLAASELEASARALRRGVDRADERRAELRQRWLGVDSWRERRWIVLGGGLTMVAALAWQVLLAEAALLDVVVADLKDYCHGRYMSALQRGDHGFLVLSDRRSANVGRTIDKRFNARFPVVHVELDADPLEAMWGHLALGATMVAELCRDSGWSLASPPRPDGVQAWANWGRIRRPSAAGD